jgi:GT2 family glycosyltransferase
MLAQPRTHPGLHALIATKDRRNDLLACLASVSNQILRPASIIIVDASDPVGDEAEVYQQAAGSLPVHYARAVRKGSASQRNQGFALVPPDAQFVSLLDDDVILEPGYLAELVTMLEHNPAIAGVGGWITNPQRAPLEYWMTWFLHLFLIYGRRPGRLLPSGFNTPMFVLNVDHPFPADVLEGGNSCLRMDAARDITFDRTFERFGGYAYAEDADYFAMLRKRGELWVNPRACMLHNVSASGRMNNLRIGIIQVWNRALFVHKHLPGSFHQMCFFWAMLGIMLLNAGMIGLGRSPGRLLGNIVGMVLVLTGVDFPQATRTTAGRT